MISNTYRLAFSLHTIMNALKEDEANEKDEKQKAC